MTTETQAQPIKREEQSLKDKVVILTGASKGLGKALAEALTKEGCKLALASRTAADLDALQVELVTTDNDNANHVLTQALDVADAGAVSHFIDTTIKTYGRIDVLINNAALCAPFQLFQEHSPQDISYHIDVNLKGPLYLMQAVLPHFIAQNSGDIINLNSIAGKQIYPYCGVYSATKWGLDAVAKTISEEQKAANIRVTNIYPGRIDTPMWQSIEPHTPQDPTAMLSVHDVAKAVIYALKQPPEIEIRDITLSPTTCD